ncbi:acyl-CoA dehydrogenase [Brevibacterium salitolerans]|uniref:Acyl-CoA dehydrogenase family protein n=1 Tax=Brevibacterium salitolerans TaxID=1403566 RepID=A0ABN2X135_9MICO
MSFAADGFAAPPFEFAEEIRAAAGDPERALRLAPRLARALGVAADASAWGAQGEASPERSKGSTGGGSIRRLWEGLAALGALDLTVARTLEPHLDALTILAQARAAGHDVHVPEDATWGVFAAEGPGTRLSASADADGNWHLDGDKPWCSLADTVSHALITAWTSAHGRRLFVVRLDDPGVTVGAGNWVARGLSAVRTVPLSLRHVPALPVGPEDWYLRRPGFALGGVGVAAVWWGGASALAGTLLRALGEREPDQIALHHLGACDAALHAAGAALAGAAHEADASGDCSWPAALRVRSIVHDACETVLTAVAHTLGPGPLTQDEEHARRVADLQVYLRQHKPERDLAAVGEGLLQGLPAVWSDR